MVQILARFDWRVVGMLFHNHDVGKGAGNSPCHFALAAVYSQLEKQRHKSIHKSFDETNSSVNFTQLLLHIGERSRSKSRKSALLIPFMHPSLRCTQCIASITQQQRQWRGKMIATSNLLFFRRSLFFCRYSITFFRFHYIFPLCIIFSLFAWWDCPSSSAVQYESRGPVRRTSQNQRDHAGGGRTQHGG